jgi:hypothetical protein
VAFVSFSRPALCACEQGDQFDDSGKLVCRRKSKEETERERDRDREREREIVSACVCMSDTAANSKLSAAEESRPRDTVTHLSAQAT